jgi:hypothetical protein
MEQVSSKYKLTTDLRGMRVLCVLAQRYGRYLAGGQCNPQCSHPVVGVPEALLSSHDNCTWQMCTDWPEEGKADYEVVHLELIFSRAPLPISPGSLYYTPDSVVGFKLSFTTSWLCDFKPILSGALLPQLQTGNSLSHWLILRLSEFICEMHFRICSWNSVNAW